MNFSEKTRHCRILAAALSLAVLSPMGIAVAQENTATDQAVELAKKLANPIASLISVPLQYNYDEYGEENEGAAAHVLNIQPVIPLSLNDDWNMITRTIVPLIDRQDFPLDTMNESGLGDVVASQFFSPKAPTAGGWIWGAGPVELLPAATDDMLGSEQWGIGPTAVALKQSGPWTVGFLTNHIWSVAGDDDRDDINATFLQPFVSYVTTTKTTFSLTTEATYDWENEQWSVPVIAQVAQLFKIGPQILQLAVGAKYWAESPDSGQEDWGLRIQLTFLFPK
ncbi:MAG: transporter [Desulfobulbaceae bacterium]|nr:MAG: transporter [Desulfobulbaceae bacterium]